MQYTYMHTSTRTHIHALTQQFGNTFVQDVMFPKY